MRDGFNKDHLRNLINEIERQSKIYKELKIGVYIFVSYDWDEYKSEEMMGKEGFYKYEYIKRGPLKRR